MKFSRIVLKPEATWKQIKVVQKTERWEKVKIFDVLRGHVAHPAARRAG